MLSFRAAHDEICSLGGEVADTAANRALVRLNAKLSGPLRETVIQLVAEAADSVIVKASRAVGRELGFLESLFDKIGRTGGLIIGGLLLLLVGALVGSRSPTPGTAVGRCRP